MGKAEASFFENVYEVVCQIPFGRVSTYGAIANYLGTASGARMVGWAMNASHAKEEKIPAHRVVNQKGLLTGKKHFYGINLMQQLLEREGAKVKEDKILNFDIIFWDPSSELKKRNAG